MRYYQAGRQTRTPTKLESCSKKRHIKTHKNKNNTSEKRCQGTRKGLKASSLLHQAHPTELSIEKPGILRGNAMNESFHFDFLGMKEAGWRLAKEEKRKTIAKDQPYVNKPRWRGDGSAANSRERE